MQRPNLSEHPDLETASTDPRCAMQRAENMAILGARTVLELCVGPSLWTLERAYAAHGIHVVGNDIDHRWIQYYPRGTWIHGCAFEADWSMFDAVVFAPPLSRGCSGTREDSLRVDQVYPRYDEFINRSYSGIRCMVLPARSLSTSRDREEYNRLLSLIGRPYDVVPLSAGDRNIRKYVDVYYRS
jgi:hypothetical protein